MRLNRFFLLVAAIIFIALFWARLASTRSSSQNIDCSISVLWGQIQSPNSPETRAVFSQKYPVSPERTAALNKKVYQIIIETDDPYSMYFGSGVVFENNGQLIIITANHIFEKAGKQTTIKARNHAGQMFRCKILQSVPENDLAILEIEAPQNILPDTVVRSLNKAGINETIYACGYYDGIAFIKMGKITAFHKKIRTESGVIYGIVESDARIGHGFSGGPALNEKDELVGIIVAMDPESNSSDISSFENIANILKYKNPPLSGGFSCYAQISGKTEPCRKNQIIFSANIPVPPINFR